MVFPESPKVSQACRSLILRILVPQNLRPKISEIQNDPWLAVTTATIQTSTESAFLVTYTFVLYNYKYNKLFFECVQSTFISKTPKIKYGNLRNFLLVTVLSVLNAEYNSANSK